MRWKSRDEGITFYSTCPGYWMLVLLVLMTVTVSVCAEHSTAETARRL